MIDPTTTFLKRLTGITLSDNERLAMRERLAAYADLHPVMPAAPAVGVFAWFSSRYAAQFAVPLVALLVLGGGVALAAEGSVPGDSLYALKIHVNEPVMTALAPTATGQARVAATLATRRVNEAVKLASRGELTPERQSYLKQEFAVGVLRAEQKANTLASSGNADNANTVRADFAASLAGEAQALGAVADKDPSASADLLNTVVATTETIANDSSAPDLAIAAEDEEQQGEEATATAAMVATAAPAEPPVHAALMAAKIAPVAESATATPATSTPRAMHAFGAFSRQLHVSTSTFERGFASGTFGRMPILLPKLDIAVPPPFAATASEDDTDR